mmetsp:Transcript_12411/g.28140  ORF Transcript_12411/g.28140 Transcript_12411/m.28140 type:complete len:208 (+) Transcript_12411:3091-3714(+)
MRTSRRSVHPQECDTTPSASEGRRHHYKVPCIRCTQCMLPLQGHCCSNGRCLEGTGRNCCCQHLAAGSFQADTPCKFLRQVHHCKSQHDISGKESLRYDSLGGSRGGRSCTLRILLSQHNCRVHKEYKMLPHVCPGNALEGKMSKIVLRGLAQHCQVRTSHMYRFAMPSQRGLYHIRGKPSDQLHPDVCQESTVCIRTCRLHQHRSQ